MSLVKELCYTARKVQSAEALSCGLVSKVFDDKERYIFILRYHTDGVLHIDFVIAF